MKKKVAVLIENELNLDFNKMFSELVKDGVVIEHVPLKHTNDSKIVGQMTKGYDYVIAGRERWDASALESVKDTLKFIARFGTGFDTLDLEAATKFGIAISNSPGMNARSVAEHAFALTLSLCRNIVQYDNDMRINTCKASLSQSLEGTFGFLGYGNIAQHFSRMLQPFDVKIIAYDLYPNYEKAKENNVEIVSQDEVLSKSDFISLHLPLNNDTQHLICNESIEKMKDGVFIINTSRGGVINEADLIAGLNNGKIRGAALDVFEKEPFDRNSEIAKAANVIVTPHAAAVSTQGVRDVFEYCVKIITDFHNGKEVKTILNKDYINN